MSTDVSTVSAVPLAFYRLGVRIRQAKTLHRVAVHLNDPIYRSKVASVVELLRAAAEELRWATTIERVLALVEEAAREWRCWVAGGHERSRSTLQERLLDVCGFVLHQARSQEMQAQLTASWF